MESITSRQNPLCTHFRKLASSRAYREECGEFLCDSPKLLDEAALWAAHIHTVLFTGPDKLPEFDTTGIRMVQVSESVMKAVSPMETPQGVVFSCGMYNDTPMGPPPKGRYLVLDGVQDPGNVGTILRTANAFGATVILLPEDLRSADLSNAAVVIGSEGRGVSPPVLERCEKTLKIPMSPHCESLNAAVAAAVVLWEGYRG